MKNKLEEFLYNNIVDINNGDWDLLFAKAVSHDISPYTLQKVLHKANVEYRLTGFSRGKIISQLDNFSMYDLKQIAERVFIDRELDFEVVKDAKNNNYIKVSGYTTFPIYYDRINFIITIHNVIMESLFIDNSYIYDILFTHWLIDGQDDHLFQNLMEGRFDAKALPVSQFLMKSEINWG